MEKAKIFFAAAFALAMLCTAANASFLDDIPLAWQLNDFGSSPLASAPVCEIGDNPFAVANNWFVPSFVAFALIIGLIAMVYVASGIAHTQKIRAWCKESLFGVLTTGIIIAVLSGAYLGMDSFGKNYLDYSIGYAHTMRNTLTIDFIGLTVFSMLVSFLSQAPSFAVWGFGIRFSLVPVLKPIFDMLGIILNMSIASLGEWFAQEFFLCFIKHNMLSIFLPMSIFLRAFTPTKGLGNTMLAIGIGFFFVYPFLVGMNADIVADMYGKPVVEAGSEVECDMSRLQFCVYGTGLWDNIKDAWGDANAPWNEITDSGWVARFFMGILGIVMVKFTGILGATMLVFVVSTVPMLLQSVAQFIFIVSIVMPLFNIFITITITMELAKVLGTEIDLSAIEKLL